MTVMVETKQKELETARNQWTTLAENEEREASRHESLGNPRGSTETYYVRADVYRRTAKSLQIEIDTGVAVCSCCFQPFGRGSRV
jgi:hypothetical protein